jgi:hypothetical protein
MGLLPLPPQGSTSTSFATCAYIIYHTYFQTKNHTEIIEYGFCFSNYSSLFSTISSASSSVISSLILLFATERSFLRTSFTALVRT